MIGWLKTIWHRLFGHYETMIDFTDEISRKDKKKGKLAAVFAYPFFFTPMVFCPENQFAAFHSNQAVVNLIFSTVGAVVVGMIPYIGSWLMILLELYCLVMMIRGMILAAQGKAKSIPLIGWITVFPYRYPGQD